MDCFTLNSYNRKLVFFIVLFLIPPEDVFIDFRERGRKWGGRRERDIYRLPPVCALTGDQILTLLVFGTMLPSTQPRGQGEN